VINNQGSECRALSDERRRLWIASLQQNFAGKNLDNIRICSAHFISGKILFRRKFKTMENYNVAEVSKYRV
jgi:hypothetical protein